MAAECATDPVENPLWWFAQEFYQQDGVEAALVELQDNWEADILLLLAACWLGIEGFDWPGDDASFQQGLVDYTSWRDHIVFPLRQMRRTLPKEGEQGFRSRLKALELESEQLGLAGLFGLLTSVPADRWQVDQALLEENLMAILTPESHPSEAQDVMVSAAVEVLLTQLMVYHQSKDE